MKSTYLVIAAALFAAGPTLCSGDEPGPKPDELFGQLDKNKDGTVTSDEVGDEHKKLFDRLVRRGDKDSDGKLSKDEFVQGFKPNDDGERPEGGPGGRGGRRGGGQGAGFDPAKMFERLDANGDGKVTLDEIPEQARERMSAMFDQLGKSEISKDEFTKSIGERRKRFEAARGEGGPPRDGDEAAEGDGPPKKFGKRGGDGPPDGDGADAGPGDRKRGRGMRGGRGGGPEGGPRIPKFAELLDTNKDHKISKDELAKASELFEKLDADSDGSLDMRELLGPPPGNQGEGGPDDGGPRKGFGKRRPGDDGPREGGSRKRGPRDGGPGPDEGREPGDNPPPRDGGPKDGNPDA